MRKFNRTLLVGPTGSGKSTLVRSIICQRNSGEEYVFITDFHRLYTCQQRFQTSDSMFEFFDKGTPPPGVYCADFGTVERGKNADAWEDFFDIVDGVSGLSDRKQNYPTTLVIDELVEFSTSLKTAPCLHEFVKYSRFAKIDLYFNTMRPLGLHQLIPTNCNRVIIFAQNRKRDLKDVMENFPLSDGDFEQMQKLVPFVWSPSRPAPVRGKHYLIFPDDSNAAAGQGQR